MEYLMFIPVLYLVLKGIIVLWNKDLDEKYSMAQYRASCLLGEGKSKEAKELMENAMLDYKHYKIRIKL